ncbi:MAG: RND transporter, partial [Opitutaceae bacterium]
MDIPRPDLLKAKRRKRVIYGSCTIVVLFGITALLSRLEPAAPTVEANLLWSDTVKQGTMVRQIRGLGTLVPDEIRWIAARTQGRVEKLHLRPGAVVTTDSIILDLTNPEVEQAAANADSQLKAAEAELDNLKNTLESQVLAAESVAAGANADYEQARLQTEVNEQLLKEGLVSE